MGGRSVSSIQHDMGTELAPHVLWSGSRRSVSVASHVVPTPLYNCPPPCTPRTLTAPRYLKFISLGGFKHVLSVLQNWGSTFVVEAPEATPPLRMSRSLSNASEASADLTEGE
jgi:hypothetical protein